MSRGETASIFEALYGPNPLRMRPGTFPTSWGEPPARPEARARWIAANTIRECVAKGDARMALAVVEARREDPAAQRERAAIETSIRLRRQELAELLLPAHLRRW